ncbi:MAG TPA: DUF3043 domain-containing protein [Microbacterium sp.]|uniref:DUF3043 domain-containing protein n=1 Tax=Microbacterium sp. TaxID=51671 RepID=UPI002B47A1D6|nr:DUF3043 domain-containing protein [Microbacterium sp.]HKT56698.1 DUF3043 domain-containing protein [Microbacterium sp.]
MAKTPAPASSDASSQGTNSNDGSAAGKGRPTPTRAEQEAARKRPLVANTKEAKAQRKAEMAGARERARIGMAAGEEKYLPAKDRGPQRRFARDYADAGWHIGELVMPLMILVIVTMITPAQAVQQYAMIVLWGFVVLVIIDMVITGMRLKRAARRKFGDAKLERGLGWYGGMRTIQMRWMRLPKPQVRRGQYPS